MQDGARETCRLAALVGTGLLTARSDETFVSLVSAATVALGVPMATISLIDSDRQIYFEKVGIDATVTERSASFCSHTISTNADFVVLDAQQDPLWRDNPLVTGEPHLRFYAGVPLRIDGQPIGTFCVLDTAPRVHFTALEHQQLRRYAAMAVEMLELRVLRQRRDSERTRFRLMAETSPDAMIVSDAEGRMLFWNLSARRLLGYDADDRDERTVVEFLPEAFRSAPAGFKALMDSALGRRLEVEVLAQDRSVRLVEMSLSRWSEQGCTFYGATLRDLTKRREMDEALRDLAHRDTLTGLPNRTVLRAKLEILLKMGAVAALLVDLDGFKDVNDTFGHASGDEVLKGAASRLLSCLRSQDLVARIGGDEFVVVLPGCRDPLLAGEIAGRIVEAMEAPFTMQGRAIRIGASVGIAIAPDQTDGMDDLLLCADLAVYKAKADGRHRYALYTPALRATIAERQRFLHEFHRALENAEFVLHYQPQVRLRDGAIIGAEALIRWQHPEHGLLQPAVFLPALLASRHAVAVGDWVLRTACRQAACWLARSQRPFVMGVNACAARLNSGEIASETMAVLAETGLPPKYLELEITENVMIARDGGSIPALRHLRNQGVGIAFDDFGTGYASLSVLEDFPLTRLKIDRSFVRKMNDRPDVPVIRAILQLAKGLNLDVIAEGIETEDQRRRLLAKGCLAGQGYLFSRPIPPKEFEALFLDCPRPVQHRTRTARSKAKPIAATA